MNNSFEEIMYKATHELAVKVMNEKELILAEWLELNKKRISDITLEEYSFEDLEKKLAEYTILKKKDTPMKMKVEHRSPTMDIYCCPNCNRLLSLISAYKNEYCPHCGQKLGWSDIHE